MTQKVTSSIDEYKLIDDKKTSEILNTSIGTLAVWRCTERYNLPFVKVGRKVMYKLSDVHKFIDQRTTTMSGG